MGYADEMAKLLRERDNIKTIPPQVGIVKSVSPLIVSLFDGQILLDSDNALICKSVKDGAKAAADMKINAYTVGATATDSRGDTISSISVPTKTDYDVEITYKDVLKVGDQVLCIEAGNKFIIIDKVEVI